MKPVRRIFAHACAEMLRAAARIGTDGTAEMSSKMYGFHLSRFIMFIASEEPLHNNDTRCRDRFRAEVNGDGDGASMDISSC